MSPMNEHGYPREIVEEIASFRKQLIDLISALPDPGVDEDGSPKPYTNLRKRLWGATRQLDELLDAALSSCLGDLTQNDPATQERLYALVVERCFTRHALADEGDIEFSAFTPEECELRIVFMYGRWMAT